MHDLKETPAKICSKPNVKKVMSNKIVLQQEVISFKQKCLPKSNIFFLPEICGYKSSQKCDNFFS